jgi:signal transduction histidine kinase
MRRPDAQPTNATTTQRPAAWHARAATFALGFVVICLCLLAGAPIWVNRRVGDLRRHSNATTERAALLSTRLRYALADEVMSHQEYRSSREAARLADYRSARRRTYALLDTLGIVARAVDSTAEHLFGRTAPLVRAWHIPQDARADNAISDAQFVASIPALRILQDSMFASESAFESHITDVESAHQRAAGDTIARQERLGLALGVIAILAGAIVAWLAWNERRLAHALADALHRERGLHEEAELRRRELAEVTESKTRLMRGFTHDVKNPLGAADGFLSLMQEGIHGPLSPKQRDVIARVRRSLRTALTLVTDLLELAKAESGAVPLRLEVVNLCVLAEDLADEYRGQAEAKGLELRAMPCADMPLVTTDGTRLHEVLGNLVSNAVKYTDRGGIQIRTSALGHHGVQIDVTDTGRGIAADKLDLLFKEFVRLDPTAAEGAGLGLASTRRIANAMGATIAVSSEPGQGSVFSVRLPLLPRPAATLNTRRPIASA